MRINHQGHYQVTPSYTFAPLKAVITQVGQSWSGTTTCFKTNPLECTLLARWDEEYQDPWLIVTDLDPDQANILWYGLRSWIEGLFKDIKRGGFKSHLTRMRAPQRVERLWLAITVAMIWLVSVGGQANAQLSFSSLGALRTPQNTSETDSHQASKANKETLAEQASLECQGSSPSTGNTQPATHPRHLSCFRCGFLVLLATIFKGDSLPIGQFFPDFSVGPKPIPIFNSG